MGGILASKVQEKEDQELRKRLGMDAKQIKIITDSWAEVKKFGTELAGMILFKKLFIAAPETFYMFDEFKDIQYWEDSKEFKHHCKIVMNIVGGAIGLLRDPESLDGTLEYLGMKHEGFQITQRHFDIMGVGLIEVLREGVGPKIMNAEAEKAWMIFYNYIVRIIVLGMNRMEVGVQNIFGDEIPPR
eukprot:scaffold1882_cov163-Ochromonas_danica.AAC.4